MVWRSSCSRNFFLGVFLMNPQKEYTPAAATDIEKTFRKIFSDYVPASQQPEIKAKHDMFKQYGRDITKDEK